MEFIQFIPGLTYSHFCPPNFEPEHQGYLQGRQEKDNRDSQKVGGPGAVKHADNAAPKRAQGYPCGYSPLMETAGGAAVFLSGIGVSIKESRKVVVSSQEGYTDKGNKNRPRSLGKVHD